jgi:aspartyl protease family protein
MCFKYLIYIIIILFILPTTSCRHRRSKDRLERSKDHNEKVVNNSTKQQGKSFVKMRKQGGVYYVPCTINGTEMEFIFDTGASDITMSLTEAKFLYKQGKLNDEDFIGKQQYQIADGSIHEGTVVVLRKVQIGKWELHDVQASIVDNMEAPLLLGQSALAAFGKISIDYTRNEITFE